jgi:hypothetical protein
VVAPAFFAASKYLRIVTLSLFALKAGMWASRPQPLRTFAPMTPTRILSVAMMIFP